MLGVVEAEAADAAGVGGGEGGEEMPDVGDLTGQGVGAEDVAVDDARLFGFREVG